MRSLQEISGKKILIITAHPDDETLWFYQSIQQLRQNNEVLILCMTYSSISKRGKELVDLAQVLNLKIIFGHCKDTGIHNLLSENEVEQAFLKIFSRHKFDILITHPPHGGEKPHPHHIQIYRYSKDYAKKTGITFGFFCEQKIMKYNNSDQLFCLEFSQKKYIFHRLLIAYKTMHRKFRFSFLKNGFFDLLFFKKKFLAYEVHVNVSDKQNALLKFESQQTVLKSYNAYYKKSEYLYLEQKESSELDLQGIDYIGFFRINI